MKILAHKNCIDQDNRLYQLDELGRPMLLLYLSLPDNKLPIIIVNDSENHVEYDDISTITNWNVLGELLGKDYIYVRERIRDILTEKTFDVCDAEEKLIVSKLFLTTPEQRTTMLTLEEEKKCWDELATAAKASREKRWEVVRRKISFYLTTSEGIDLYTTTRDLSLDYKDANIPSLVCWITNSAMPELGIDYTTTGFAQKPYYTTELRDMIVDILVEGNY